MPVPATDALAALSGRADLGWQLRLLTRARDALRRDDRIAAAFVTGSLARGNADAQSDLDLLLISDASFPAVVDEWETLVDAVAPTVFRRRFGQPPSVIATAITPDWCRFDLVVQPVSEVSRRTHGPSLALFDREGARITLPQRLPAPVSAARLTELVEEFLRVLGLLPVVLARDELLVGVDGVILLRRMLTDLMLAERGDVDRGGVKRLNPLLGEDQRAALDRLPPLAPTREAVVEGSLACARLFLPLARRVLGERGIPYPSAFEDATVAHLERALGFRALTRD